MKHPKANVIPFTRPREESHRQAIERLFSEHGAALRIFLLARARFDDDIEDIVQQLFLDLTAMQDLFTRIAPESGNNRAFLFTCANNLLLLRERRRALERRYSEQQQRLADNEAAGSEQSPEFMAVVGEELDAVMEGIRNLQPNYRRTFVLSRFHYLSYPQIASRIGVSVKQVEKYMSGALKKLRAISEQYHQQNDGNREESK